MTYYDFCKLMDAGNIKRAMALAVRREIPDGDAIVDDEHAAYTHHKAARTPESRARLEQCRQRREAANRVIRERYGL